MNQNAKQTKISSIRWFFVVLILIGAVINYLDRSNLAIANTLIEEEFGLNATEMGALLSAFLLPYAFANLPAGWLVDKLGVRKLFGGAIALWSFISLLLPFAGFKVFYCLRAGLGVAESPFFPAATKAVNTWFTKDDRGLPLAIVNTGSQIANAIAPPLLTTLIILFDWKTMFIIIALLGFVVALVWFLTYRDPHIDELKALAEKNTDELLGQEAEQVGWLALFRYPSTWYMVLGNFGICYPMWICLTWLPSYLMKERGLALSHMGMMASIPFIAGIFGVILGGIVSDALIRRGWKPLSARKVPLVLGSIVAALSFGSVTAVQDLNACIALLALGYFAASFSTGVVWTLATDVAPRHMVASLGAIQNFGGFIGAALAPLVTGYIIDMTGRFELAFLVGALLLIISAIIYAFFLKKRIGE